MSLAMAITSLAVGSFPTAAIEAAAAAEPFDIIFNNGLHSLRWSPDQVTDAQIEAVYRQMVQTFRKGAPKAKLVWASTTPVTAGSSPVTGVGELNPVVIRINTRCSAFQFMASAPFTDSKGKPQTTTAYLWIPEKCRTIRGIVLAQHALGQGFVNFLNLIPK